MNAPRRALVAAGAAVLCLAGIGQASAVLPGGLASATSPTASGTSTRPSTSTAASATTAPAGARFEAKLLRELDAAGPTGVVEVLVGATSAAAATSAIQASGLTPMITFDKVGFAATRGPAAQVRAIAAQPGVTYLQGNRSLRSASTTANVATRVVEAEQTFTAPGGQPLDGSGVGIAIVDSGMSGAHPMYQDATGKTRLLNVKQLCANLLECGAEVGNEPDEYFVNATGIDTDAMALGGHGTHVTSIAGGQAVHASNGVLVRGVARNASLYGIGAGAGLFTINAGASLNWVLEHHANPCGAFTPAPDVAGGCAPIRVVNNSYGSPGDYDPADFFAVVGERLVLEGVTVVWSAGNGDDITATDPRPNDGSVNLTNPPGQSPKNGILMIANYDDHDSGTRDADLNSSSSRGQKHRPETYPDFAAPGTNILAACRPYLPICSSGYADPDYGEISGTSMAAPHVTGLVALLLQAHPELTPEQVEDVLEDTAHKFGDPATYEPDVASAGAPVPNQVRNDTLTSFDKGHGLVDLSAALYKLAGLADPGVPSADNPCAAAGNSFADPGDDATELILRDTGVGALSYPGLDVVGGSVTPLPDNTARFAIKLKDLTDAVAPGSVGENFRFDFSFDGKAYELDLQREVSGVGTYATDFFLFQNGLTTDIDIALHLPGGFDTATDEVWAIVPSDAIKKVYADSPLLSYGSRLEGVSVLAQRLEGVPGSVFTPTQAVTDGTDAEGALGGVALTATVDTAPAACPLLLPQPQPAPSPLTAKSKKAKK